MSENWTLPVTAVSSPSTTEYARPAAFQLTMIENNASGPDTDDLKLTAPFPDCFAGKITGASMAIIVAR
jgi:hypothetical protein